VIDLARAHVLALGACDGTRVYNLGCGGDGTTVLEVIEAAREVTGRKIDVEFGARRPGDPARLVASSARAERDLGWRPELADIRGIVESAWRFSESRR
jgi:UDP-glucose 4-epimerase